MVRDGRLAHVTALCEVAGANLVAIAQLAKDRESRGISRSLQEQDVGIGLTLHEITVLTSVNIVKYQYIDPVIRRRAW